MTHSERLAAHSNKPAAHSNKPASSQPAAIQQKPTIARCRRYWIHIIARSVGVASVTFGDPSRLYVHRPRPSAESVFRRTLDGPPSSVPRGRRPARTRAPDPLKSVIHRACHALGVPFPDQWKATTWLSLLRAPWETLQCLPIGCTATETLAGFTSTEERAAFAGALAGELGLEPPLTADGAYVFHRTDNPEPAVPTPERTAERARSQRPKAKAKRALQEIAMPKARHVLVCTPQTHRNTK